MTRQGARKKDRRTAIFVAVGIVVLVLALVGIWHWTPLQEYAEPRRVAGWLQETADEGWMPVLVAAVYIGASLVMFPNTVLCLAVILALGPLAGATYAYGGSLAAAIAGYAIGRRGGRGVQKLHVRAVDKLTAELRRGGFAQVLALRFLPVAPFSATNMISGASRVPLLPFLAATVVGISPYILAFAAFGRQARRLLSDPTPTDAAIMAAVMATVAVAAWQARKLAAARLG